MANEARAAIPYDFSRLDTLQHTRLFAPEEQSILKKHDALFKEKLQRAPIDIIRRERERISIEFSWKSSQIEWNTYTLLETESLIKDGIQGRGKSHEETIMILNHKKALDFIEQNKNLFTEPITPAIIIYLHSLLAEGIIETGLREHGVGITTSVYQPLSSKFHIQEELARLCWVIQSKPDVFEQALIAFAYICYLQPFNDGNKRTVRVLANALLYAQDSFPLSLRAVSVNTYKLAILAFYELGTLGNVKKIIIDQAAYASEHYAI